jgi:polyhydroxyalkanoate synthase
MDLGPRFSIARHLRARGYDVWSLDLRGHGQSRLRRGPKWSRRGISFDDHALSDVPAAIDLVLRERPHGPVHWVGHSMGGMAIYAYLGVTQDRRVRSICTLGSPARFSPPRLIGRLVRLLPLISFLPHIPGRWATALAIPFYRSWPISFLSHHGSHVATRTIRLAMANLVEDLPMTLVKQFARWMKTGRFESRDGRIDYARSMGRIEAPACLLSGMGDEMVAVSNVEYAYECLGSRTKQLIRLGVDEGHRIDYDHGGLAIADSAPEEIYPLIASWLAQHASSRPTRSRRPDRGEINPYNPFLRRRRERYFKRLTPNV